MKPRGLGIMTAVVLAALPVLISKLPAGATLTPLPALAAAAGFYLAAHGFRVLRLMVILGEQAPSLRRVALAHLAAAPPAAAMPFKLGELWRIWLLGKAAGGVIDGLAAVWLERVFDAVCLLGLGLLIGSAPPAAFAVLAAAASFLVFSLLAVYAIPENLSALKLFLIRRYTSRAVLRLLALAHGLGRALERARAMLSGKLVTLALLSVAVWGLEMAALAALLPTLSAIPTALLATLSAELERAVATTLPAEALLAFAAYRLVVAVVLSAAALAALALAGYKRGSLVESQ